MKALALVLTPIIVGIVIAWALNPTGDAELAIESSFPVDSVLPTGNPEADKRFVAFIDGRMVACTTISTGERGWLEVVLVGSEVWQPADASFLPDPSCAITLRGLP